MIYVVQHNVEGIPEEISLVTENEKRALNRFMSDDDYDLSLWKNGMMILDLYMDNGELNYYGSFEEDWGNEGREQFKRIKELCHDRNHDQTELKDT